jgi:hypothetical protein
VAAATALARRGVSERGPLDFPAGDDEQRPSAGERLAEADRREQRSQPPPPSPRRARYGWLFALIVVVAMAYVTVNILRSDGTGPRGVPAGQPLPPFAVPLALGSLNGDANVADRPNEGGRGARPACQVRGPQILNVCQLVERGPVVLAFFVARDAGCERQLDLLERVRRSPAARGVQIAAVAIRGNRSRLRDDIRRRGWRFPVGYDRDGLLASIYGVAVCPTITFAYPGGIARLSTVGFLDARELAGEVAALTAASRARGWKPAR